MSALRFINARIVCPVSGIREGELLVEGEKIVDVLSGEAETIDCRGKTLAPAIIDVAAFAADKAACRRGGIARVALMPDQSPVLDDPGIVRRAATMGKPELWIHPL
ncbi:MAG: dihydroorotase, partial [Sphingomonadales bacterium]|nr:dihydroorotase [Sphingomonadales bacterium]